MSMESFNACVYLVDRQVQAGLGGQLAVTGPAGSLTYAELAARAAELAAGFQAAGVRPEERVLLVATDRPETVITFWPPPSAWPWPGRPCTWRRRRPRW
jgi:acyl-CoA synthetase (AMP-forming)/AMP-acid ligase II